MGKIESTRTRLFNLTHKRQIDSDPWKKAHAIIAFFLFFSPSLFAEGLQVPAKVVRVYDGDTFTADAEPWPRITIRVSVRLVGMDTPEIRGKCPEEKRLAIEAREALKTALGGIGGEVMLQQVKRGKYSGRVVALVVNQDGRNVSEAMIQSGHGRVYDGGKREGWCRD